MTETLAPPRIDNPEELDRMVRQIVAKVDPVAIYLFGSRARGDADPDSDYDLMIVVPDDFPPGQANPLTAFSLVEGRRIPMDVTMSRATRFAMWRRIWMRPGVVVADRGQGLIAQPIWCSRRRRSW